MMSFNLKRVLFGKFCSLFAASLFTFVAGLTVLRETSSGFQFALVLLAGSMPRILLSPIAGVLADRWNRKRIIVTTESLSALVLSGLLLSSLQAPLHTVHYIVASVLLTSLSIDLNDHCSTRCGIAYCRCLDYTILGFTVSLVCFCCLVE